jgi:uncharacterized phage-associated protein
MTKGASLAFCINCGNKMPYSVIENRIENTVKNTKFSYIEQAAKCTECGEEIYVPEINDANVEARETAYRKALGLITVEDVRHILKEFNIGAGPLALLMGFGEVTINRYLAGQLPSKDHSEKLLALKGNYELMDKYLEDGRDKITEVAYTKCRTAVDNLKQLYISNKIELVTKYFLCKNKDITPLALQKILYYAQAFFHALFGENLFSDDCQAWAYGPVYPDVYYKFKDYRYDPIDRPPEEFENIEGLLSVREINFLDSIIAAFGDYSGTVLRDMTHNEIPWIQTRGSLAPTDRSTTVIDRALINQYFDEVVNKYNMINPCDICKYSNHMYRVVR